MSRRRESPALPTSSRSDSSHVVSCTWLYLRKYAPRYKPGNIFNLISCSCAIAISLGLTFYVRWENRQRDLGRRDYRVEGKTEEEIQELGYRHPEYRLKE